jgi:hypothetical protein
LKYLGLERGILIWKQQRRWKRPSDVGRAAPPGIRWSLRRWRRDGHPPGTLIPPLPFQPCENVHPIP